ncbi:uncharacterized protein RMCC_2723 [Mycolicibacterium canariasense]|uniref:Uncharacterized protein n=2 Tax=Mycolicibacterium canariasense TaxID=228230 RepID=A0A100WCF4_MYCCR|nr:hypothetical protein AWB94_19730 [Mycolicibacterium canariasense]GAS95757.1 uncharacterized protein RMCC_2723 [Mycolicibacterium canariasense]
MVSEREAARIESVEQWKTLAEQVMRGWVQAVRADEDPKLIAELEDLLMRCVVRQAALSSICFL